MELDLPEPIHIIHDSRYARQDGWRIDDISLCSSGNIAVSGTNYRTRGQAYVFIYSSTDDNSDSRDKPTLLYHKQFTDEELSWRQERCISFIKPNSTEIVTCRYDEVQVIDYNRDVVLRSRKVNGVTTCLSVSESQIFIGFFMSDIVDIYDNDLNRIKSIRLKGIRDHYPGDIVAAADRLYVRTAMYYRAIVYSQYSGNILTEYTTGQDRSNAYNIAVNIQLQIVAVLWERVSSKKHVSVYSFSDNNCLVDFDVESGVSRIRISDGGRIVTGNLTGEIKIYDLGSLLSYSYLKENLLSRLGKDDCKKLTDFFAMGGEELNIILSSERPAASFLLALEEKGVIQPSNVDKLEEAFHELKMSPSLYHTVALYKKLRDEITYYDRFLATLAAHLTSSVVAKLCHYFKVLDEQQRSIEASQNPGLSLLLVLDEMGVIKSSDVGSLEEPLHQLRLVQAVAKIHEYKEFLLEENRRLLRTDLYSSKEKRAMFVELLKKKIKSWYETMTPVPWKKSCQWKSADLFVGSGLILIDSKSKQNIQNIDEKCKLSYKEILTHKKLKSEIRIKLEGDPGAGKTMLLSQLAYDWSKGNIDGVDILIFLPLKIVGDQTLIQAVKEFYIPMDMGITEEDIETILASTAETICLLLDGLEEYNTGKGKDETKESTEVMKIMKKEKHSNCKVVISTRSDFAHDLSECPSLKVGTFGEPQRESYIKQLYADDTDKQQKIQSVIQNNSFLLDLCSVPLLFVLAVHNIGNISLSGDTQLYKVSPFIRNMILTLCPAAEVKHEIEGIPSEFYASKKMTLGELAFNGLCKGHQQLSWPKAYMESNVLNLKLWVDSGILVLEEGLITPEKQDQDVSDAIALQGKEFPGPSASHDTLQSSTLPELSMTASASGTPTYRTEASVMRQAHEGVSKIEKDPPGIKQKSVKRTAHQVPLVVKFLHKVIQEWFAAIFFSSMMRRPSSKDEFQNYVTSQLQHIRATDLHYILRFTSYLHPPSCHLIMNYLLRNYRKGGSVPPYIMNCVFLCFNEHNDDKGPDMRNVVEDVCKEVITIQSEDSRLLQKAKSDLLEFASSDGVVIQKLQLEDVILSVDKTNLTLNSGVKMGLLNTVKLVTVSRWDQVLKEEDCKNILKLLSASMHMKEVCCIFPIPPPNTLDEMTLLNIASKNIKVEWHIGNFVHTLDPRSGKWSMKLNQPGSTTIIETKDVSVDTDFYTSRKTVITKVGGTLEISNTGILLIIPPDALPADKEEHDIQMRYIPRRTVEDQVKGFSSNSSAVVEILPSFSLVHPASLILPHCLVLQQNVERKAKIFASHHDQGSYPRWEELKDISYHVEDTACILLLNSFSWFKYSIDEKIVLAKQLVVYAAAQKPTPQNDMVRIEVGCYPYLPGHDQDIPGGQNLIVADEKILFFVKSKKQNPLQIFLNDIAQRGRECQHSSELTDTLTKKIPYKNISDDLGGSCVYLLKRSSHAASMPLCVFTVLQDRDEEMDSIALQLSVNLKALEKVPSTSGPEGHRREILKAETTIAESGVDLEIPGTSIVLKIPPNALKGTSEDHLVGMRVIPARTMEDRVTTFSSNSCTAVEVYPHTLNLRCPVELYLPHCLRFIEDSRLKARIYTNNQKGSPAVWKENRKTHTLDEKACVIKLSEPCCVQYSVDDNIVRGKVIRMYTALKRFEPDDKVAELQVGFCPDVPAGDELLRMNSSFIVDSKQRVLIGKENISLQLSLDAIVPSSWECWFPMEKPQKIPTETIVTSIGHAYLFIMKRTSTDSVSATCIFKALQKEEEIAELALTVCPETTSLQGSSEQASGQTLQDHGTTLEADSQNRTIKLLSKKLRDEWRDVCRSLGVEGSIFRAERNNQGNIQESIYQCLLSWKESSGCNATFETLQSALEENGRSDLAHDVKKYKELFS